MNKTVTEHFENNHCTYTLNKVSFWDERYRHSNFLCLLKISQSNEMLFSVSISFKSNKSHILSSPGSPLHGSIFREEHHIAIIAEENYKLHNPLTRIMYFSAIFLQSIPKIQHVHFVATLFLFFFYRNGVNRWTDIIIIWSNKEAEW